jgi:lipopolysaccharide transport system permease protein
MTVLSTTQAQETILILEPGRSEKNYWGDLWRYRELFFVLAWRNVSVRYKQTVIGVVWAILRPFLTMVVLTVVFGRLAKLPTEGTAPYALMVFAAMLPWQLFASALTASSGSLVGNVNLISKVYFPRLIMPAATQVAALVDFLISFAVLVAMMAYYRYVPGWQVLFLPLFIALALLASFGPGAWLTAVNVKYRDVGHVVPFIVQFGLYISPVGFSSNVIPEKWRLLYSLNPMVGVIDGFRWCILGGESTVYMPGFILSLGVTATFLWYGLHHFRKVERTFADII